MERRDLIFLFRSWTILFTATLLAHSNVTLLFIDTLPAIAALSFMLINVRVGLGWAQWKYHERGGELGKVSTVLSFVGEPRMSASLSEMGTLGSVMDANATLRGLGNGRGVLTYPPSGEERATGINGSRIEDEGKGMESVVLEADLSDGGSDYSTQPLRRETR